MKPTTKSNSIVLTAAPTQSDKLVMLNTLVLLSGLVVLIISINIVSGF